MPDVVESVVKSLSRSDQTELAQWGAEKGMTSEEVVAALMRLMDAIPSKHCVSTNVVPFPLKR